jgi:hypothetical protein
MSRPFRPANGTEGQIFLENWCERCSKDNFPEEPVCPIIIKTMAYEIDDPEYPKEWQLTEDGVPFCADADLCD